jgi:hypothetical protein
LKIVFYFIYILARHPHFAVPSFIWDLLLSFVTVFLDNFCVR